MCFEVFRSAAQERAGLAAQAALQFAQRLGVGRLVGARFGGYGAALSGADVEPRLYGDAGEERYRGCEYSAVKPAWRPASSFSWNARPMTGTM